MKYTLSHDSSFPLVYVNLNRNEQIRMERGSMVYHNGLVKIEGNMNSNGAGGIGGAFKAIGRSLTSGESFFITTATGQADDAMIALAPSRIGQVRELIVDGRQQWCLNDGSFVACDSSVQYEMKRQSIGKALFAGTGGLFVMESTGQGSMLVAGFGDILEINLDGSSNFVIDNFHVVAWERSLSYSIKIASGVFGFTTGEGLVNEFSGAGKVLIQARNISSFATQIIPFLPKSK